MKQTIFSLIAVLLLLISPTIALIPTEHPFGVVEHNEDIEVIGLPAEQIRDADEPVIVPVETPVVRHHHHKDVVVLPSTTDEYDEEFIPYVYADLDGQVFMIKYIRVIPVIQCGEYCKW